MRPWVQILHPHEPWTAPNNKCSESDYMLPKYGEKNNKM